MGWIDRRAVSSSCFKSHLTCAHPDQAGHGEYLPLVGDFMSFNEIIDTQDHNFSFNQMPTAFYAGLFAGAAEIAEMLNYFQAHTYLGSD